MANPFDQFDKSAAVPAPAAAPVVVPPGQNPDAVAQAAAPVAPEADMTDPSNPFNNPTAALATAQQRRMSPDEFTSAFYDKLNAGESSSAILQWSSEVGRPIQANEAFYENIRIRDEALRNKRKGTYGRVNELKQGESQPLDIADAGGAFVRQAGNTALFNFGDEIDSALRAVPELLSGGDVEKAYADRWNDLNTRNELDWTVHPGPSAAGVATGAILGARATPSIMDIGRVRNAGLVARSAAGGAEGAAYGAIAATGEGTPEDRLANTGAGAGIGGAIGAAVSPAMAAIGRIGRPIVERMRPDEAKALARRLKYSPEQIAAAEAELARQRSLGIQDSTLLDVIDEPGRSVVGSAGAHDAARAELQDVAAARNTQLPERVGAAANEIVAPPNAAELGVSDDVRSGIEAQRDAEISAALDAEIAPGMRFRDTPIDITPEIADVLGTTMGQRAIRAVIDETTDPNLRNQLATLQSATRTRARSVDPRLPESAQQAAQGSLMQDMPFSIDLSERLGRKLNQMGRESGNGALFSFGRTVREGANASPRFREIMEQYGQMSRHSDAVGVGSGVRNVMDELGNVSRVADEGAGFLAEPASRFETRVSGLSNEQLVHRIETTPGPDLKDEEVWDAVRQWSDGDDYTNFSGFNAEDINRAMRLDSTSSNMDGRIKALKEAITRFGTRLDEDTVVYRGLLDKGDVDKDAAGVAYLNDAMAGGPVKSFTSVSTHPDKAANFAEYGFMRGVLPKGTLVFKVPSGKWGDEGEILLPPGVMKVDKDSPFPAEPPAGMDAQTWAWNTQSPVIKPAQFTFQPDELVQVELRKATMGNGRDLPSERDLARLGAAEQVATRAGKGPSEARGVASQLYDSPEQRARSVALLGEAGADKLAGRMREEVERVYRASRQASKEGPAKEGGLAAVESGVNTLYNPGPISFIRESARFLHRIGMTERDALWIVRNATDPSQTQAILNRLKKAGVDELQARAYTDQLRDAAVRYSVSNEEN